MLLKHVKIEEVWEGPKFSLGIECKQYVTDSTSRFQKMPFLFVSGFTIYE